MTDGLSKTFLAGEVIAANTPDGTNIWSYASRQESCFRATENPLNMPPGSGTILSMYGHNSNAAFGSDHAGGGNFLFGDGRVDFVDDGVDLTLYRAYSTYAGPHNGGVESLVP